VRPTGETARDGEVTPSAVVVDRVRAALLPTIAAQEPRK
jgi:hypothetical protein